MLIICFQVSIQKKNIIYIMFSSKRFFVFLIWIMQIRIIQQLAILEAFWRSDVKLLPFELHCLSTLSCRWIAYVLGATIWYLHRNQSAPSPSSCCVNGEVVIVYISKQKLIYVFTIHYQQNNPYSGEQWVSKRELGSSENIWSILNKKIMPCALQILLKRNKSISFFIYSKSKAQKQKYYFRYWQKSG